MLQTWSQDIFIDAIANLPKEIQGNFEFILFGRILDPVFYRKILKISRNSYINAIKKYPHYAILLSKLLAKKLVRANTFKVKGELSTE